MTKRRLFALLFSLLIVLAPSFADARAGGSYGGMRGGSFSSMGSMGSRSFGFGNGAQPLQRSLTPPTSPYAGQPGYGAGGYGFGHPFLSGLAGGFFGSWIGSMLFPHWGMGYGGYGGYGGGFGVIGSLFSWLILLGLIWMAIRFFVGRGFARSPSAAPMSYGGGGLGGMGFLGSPRGYAVPAQPPGAPLAIAGADYQEFETALKQVQAAWSRGDLNALRAATTPEMLSYFSEELAENQSRGVVNHVDKVELLRGDLRQAWDEGHLQYASCYLHWRALDYTVRADAAPGEAQLIVDGDPRQPSEAGEVWTFARAPGGHWLLSAIQQA